MKVEYDSENAETILHMNAEELGSLIFALDVAEMSMSNPGNKLRMKLMRTHIRQELEK